MKTFKRLLFSGMGLTLLLILSGCVQTNKQGQPTGEGFVYQFLVAPMSKVITYFAHDLNLGFGLAIILVTIIVRLIILPLGLYQSWNATYQSEKRNYLSPIFTPINERMKNAETQEEKLAAQQALVAAQKENGLSMLGGVGCLPLLIQMPFFSTLREVRPSFPGNLTVRYYVRKLREWLPSPLDGPQAPLSFTGQKRRFLKSFKALLNDHIPNDGAGWTILDAFGGSGLLAHAAKRSKPAARVIYNDYDGYSERLQHRGAGLDAGYLPAAVGSKLSLSSIESMTERR